MSQEILAVVAGEQITGADVDHFIENMPQEQRVYASNPHFRNHCLDQLVTIRAYAKLGEEMRLDETDEFKRIIENAKKELLAQMAMAETLKGIAVTEEEVAAFYEENPHLFKKGETVSAKHILVKEEDECKEILSTIENGEKSFEDAAKEKSTCPSGGRGGDLGEFGRGQMVKEFEDAAFDAEIGAVVGPVKTQFGYHLIKVEKKNEASVMELAQVSEQIRSNLIQQKQNQVYMEKAEELKAKYVEK